MNWKPISELTEEHKDGRWILFWLAVDGIETSPSIYRFIKGSDELEDIDFDHWGSFNDLHEDCLFKEVGELPLPTPQFIITEKDVGRKVKVLWKNNHSTVSIITDFYTPDHYDEYVVCLGPNSFDVYGEGLMENKITGWADERLSKESIDLIEDRIED